MPDNRPCMAVAETRNFKMSVGKGSKTPIHQYLAQSFATNAGRPKGGRTNGWELLLAVERHQLMHTFG
jgi:hypothetical protein